MADAMADGNIASAELERVVRMLNESARALTHLIGRLPEAAPGRSATVPRPGELDELDELARELRELQDDDLVSLLLAMHERTTASARSPGTRQRLLQESRVILACLARFAAGSLTRALAESHGDQAEGGDGRLRCIECGRSQRGEDERGWRTFLTSVAPPELVTFCPDCAGGERPPTELETELVSRAAKKSA